ncbi:MAG TPA: hypothetical protein VFI27_05460, partial [candidate division Zixibacteria bacterium]|nr:hypothetical protein [candidate division Zixibacteria bacterium]
SLAPHLGQSHASRWSGRRPDGPAVVGGLFDLAMADHGGELRNGKFGMRNSHFEIEFLTLDNTMIRSLDQGEGCYVRRRTSAEG